MKKLILTLLFCLVVAGGTQAQEIEILLLGTQHNFQDSLLHKQEFGLIRQRLADFAPDIICIESVPVTDRASLAEVRTRQMELAARMKEARSMVADEGLTGRLIDQLGNADSLVVRSKLANQYYVNHDFWNAYYHYFLLAQSLSDVQEPVDNEALLKSFSTDSIHTRVYRRERLTEYGNIVYPLGQQLGIHRFENIDYRAGEEEFLRRVKRAFIGTIFNLRIFKLRKRFRQLEKGMQEAEQQGRLMEFINSAEQQAFYLDMIDRSAQFLKTQNMNQVRRRWELRNQIMADRILAAAEQTQSQRVLVTVGAFHIPFIKRYLQSHPGIRVITYDQLNNQSTIKKSK